MNDFRSVIDSGFCIGCGVCSVGKPDLIPKMNDDGLLVPLVFDNSINEFSDILCPFTDSGLNEDQLADKIFANTKIHEQIGRYLSLGVASVHNDVSRFRTSSGGVITEVNHLLLKTGVVDAVILVGPANQGRLFDYQVCENQADLIRYAKSKYYPVELGTVLNKVLEDSKRYAIVALPCFTKALRSLQDARPDLREKFPFITSLICGHLKSAFFADYLGWQAGLEPGQLSGIDFRVKDPNKAASRYGVTVHSATQQHSFSNSEIKLNDWGLGLFKPLACDYCDDVFAELGDLSVGDAWIKPYVDDYRGHSLVIIRSAIAEEVLRLAHDTISFTPLSEEQILDSQVGGVKHKREYLAHRLWVRMINNLPVPNKRVTPKRASRLDASRIEARSLLREESFIKYREARERKNLNWFISHLSPLVNSYYKVTVPIWKRCLKRIIGYLR